MLHLALSPTSTWDDYINPTLEQVENIVAKNNFHPLDRDAILEENQYARLDTYPEYLFLVLHFPKYDSTNKRYIQNEFDIFVSAHTLTTIRYFATSSVTKLQSAYKDKDTDVSIPYALYQLLESLLLHVMRMLEKFGKDLRIIERELFESSGTSLIADIMVRKRNIITLKHMMKPQIAVLKHLQSRVDTLFGIENKVYFEDLEDKIDKIYSEIELLQENIDSMEDTLKSVFELKTNTTIKYLTIFSAFMLPLTLITSFFGMNMQAGHFQDIWVIGTIVATILGLCIFTMYSVYRKYI
jgi:magnesium transporter